MKNLFFVACLILGLSSFKFHSSNPPLTGAPIGTITGWGLRGSIPRGWVICNGANGTPDLVGRFPYGTANSSEIGQLIGTPNHSHLVSGTTDIPNDLNAYNGDNRALQKDGPQRVYHSHNFSVRSSTESSIPPGTKIIFIMKIR